MAIMAQNGLGMTENADLAFRYMKAAAEAGIDLAQLGVGFMYMEGECAPKNPEHAVHWFRKAAEQGLAGSQTTLAMMYARGRGVPRTWRRARGAGWPGLRTAETTAERGSGASWCCARPPLNGP
jgi:TPR repeat protein